MRIIFVAAGPIEWGSSRMRAYWPARYIEGAEVVQWGKPIPTTADAYIWQKLVNMDAVKATPAALHYWDVCDPAWWWEPERCAEIVREMQGVVCSSEALAADFKEWSIGLPFVPIRTISDRLELSHFDRQRQHAEVSPVRFIWFGVAVNRIALYAAAANLERLVANGYKIELTVMDDRPDVPLRLSDAYPIYNIPWRLDTEVEVLSNHDIALLPPYPGPWGMVKSNNKSLTAHLCNLPSTNGQNYKDFLDLMTAGGRETYARFGVRGNFDVRQSAGQWEALLDNHNPFLRFPADSRKPGYQEAVCDWGQLP